MMAPYWHALFLMINVISLKMYLTTQNLKSTRVIYICSILQCLPKGPTSRTKLFIERAEKVIET